MKIKNQQQTKKETRENKLTRLNIANENTRYRKRGSYPNFASNIKRF